MKNLLKNLRFLLVILAIGTFSSCGDDDDTPDAEPDQEVITTVQLTFVPQGGGTTIVADAVDADGAGPNPIEVTDIELAANTTYNVTATFLNELETPAEDITEEIEEEGIEHQIFWNASANSSITVEYNDKDENELPIGLATIWTTGEEAIDGTVTMTLKHQPDGIKSATSTVNDGETDINVTFTSFVRI